MFLVTHFRLFSLFALSLPCLFNRSFSLSVTLWWCCCSSTASRQPLETGKSPEAHTGGKEICYQGWPKAAVVCEASARVRLVVRWMLLCQVLCGHNTVRLHSRHVISLHCSSLLWYCFLPILFCCGHINCCRPFFLNPG